MIGYKKLSYSFIAKIQALGNIIRVDNYFRTDKMKILTIEDENGKEVTFPVCNHFTMFDEVYYTVGETYKIENMNTDTKVIMCNGFHFFVNKEEAKKYFCQTW